MSFWGRVFGTDEAIRAVASAARDGLDALVYTDEERASDAAADRKQAREMLVRWMEATQGQNLARRLIAVTVTFVWLGMYLCSLLLELAAVWVSGYDLSTGAQLIGDRADKLDGAVMLILSFYFAAPYMGNIVDKAMDKFGGKS